MTPGSPVPPAMPETDRKHEVLRRLMAAQSRLYAYAVALLHDPDAAHDVLQNANVVMLAKLDELTDDRDPVAWALTVVRYEVMGYRRDHARDRLLFDDAFIARVADAAADRAALHDARVRALHRCMATLTDAQRSLIESRYAAADPAQAPADTVRRLAEATGRPYGSVRQALHRIRAALLDCINRRLATEDAP